MRRKAVRHVLAFHRGRGRPRKFDRPARAVTLTLPEDVLAALTEIDEDVSRAIVRVMSPLAATAARLPAAELSKYGNSAVIVIRPDRVFERIEGVTLVPLPDGRALVSLDDSMTVPEFELKLRDVLDDQELKPHERASLASIVEILRMARQTRGISIEERNIIVLQTTPSRPSSRRARASERGSS
jgi:hypothetical protein